MNEIESLRETMVTKGGKEHDRRGPKVHSIRGGYGQGYGYGACVPTCSISIYIPKQERVSSEGGYILMINS